MKHNIVSLEEVKYPKSFMKSLATGISNLDSFLSVQGGLVPSMAYMFTGVSGSGKTTISNYIMSGVSKDYSPAIFISLEMNKEQTKYQFEGKVDFKNVLIVDEIPHNTIAGFLELLQSISELNPSVIVLDSLQMLSSLVYGDPTSQKGQSDIARIIMKFSKKTGCPSIIIGQCNKEGDYLGPTFVKHILDAHLHALIDKKTGERTISFEKNRFGNVNHALCYSFRPDGSIYFENKVEEKMSQFLSQPIIWGKLEDIITKLHFDIIASEYKMMKGRSVPKIKFKGTDEVPKNHPQFHPKFNSWVNTEEIQNTIFIDVEWSLRVFREVKVKKFNEDFLMLANRYQKIKTASDMFWLNYVVCLAHGILNSQEKNDKYYKLLDKLVEKYL
jgi:RecA/RadA recombinase